MSEFRPRVVFRAEGRILFLLEFWRFLVGSWDCWSFGGGLDRGRLGFSGNCWICSCRCDGCLRFCRIRIWHIPWWLFYRFGGQRCSIFARYRLCSCLSGRCSCNSRRRGLLRGGSFFVCIFCKSHFSESIWVSCNMRSRGPWHDVLFLESSCCRFLSPWFFDTQLVYLCWGKGRSHIKTLCKRGISVRLMVEERHTIYVVRTLVRAHNISQIIRTSLKFGQSARANFRLLVLEGP